MDVVAQLDPTAPLMLPSTKRPSPGAENQRRRRAVILAKTRGLLTKVGFDNITTRRLANEADVSVQTIYNIIGNRESVICEAISEFMFLARNSVMPNKCPNTLVQMDYFWWRTVTVYPEFCREANRTYFGGGRKTFQEIMSRHIFLKRELLYNQQKSNIIRPEIDIDILADYLGTFCSMTCLDWADRPYSSKLLGERLIFGHGQILTNALASERADELACWIDDLKRTGSH